MRKLTLAERDKRVNWHPYTQMQTSGDTIPIIKGDGAWLIAEDGTKYLVDHRHAENMGECIKKRREAVNKYKDPKHRELMGGTRFMFMCDKVRAEVEILEDGTWHINKILGRYDPAYKKKKSYK